MKRTVIHTPNLCAIRFIGNFDKKLFEIGGRTYPQLNKDDDNIVIVTEVQAMMLARQPHFEKVDLKELLAGIQSTETDSNEDVENKSTETDSNEDVENKSTETDSNEDVENKSTETDSNEDVENKSTETDSGANTFEVPKTLEDLQKLNRDELLAICRHFGITAGSKKDETLVSLILPFLKLEN